MRVEMIWCCLKRALPAVLLACVLLSFNLGMSLTANAQGTTGSITGAVTDSTGSAIPDAAITILQVETNSVHQTTSSESGVYTVPQLPPGTYRITIDKPGFARQVVNDRVLTINEVAQINGVLTVGSDQQIINVTSEAPVLQTDSSSVGLLVDAQAIQNIPLNGHTSVIGLIALAPGVQAAGSQDQPAYYGVTPAIGASGRSSYGGVGFTIDGIQSKSVGLQRGLADTPSLDAIGEFKVLTTGAPAEFNQPGQVIIVSQTGGNAYHGEGFEFNRGKGTSAKEYFSGPVVRPPYERNEYGGNFEGPIFIPHLYNGHDKSFFFAAYEGFHLTQSLQLNSFQPTVAQSQGNFTGYAPLTDPATGAQMQCNGQLNYICTGRFNAVDQKLQSALIPLSTTSSNNITELVPFSAKVNRFSLRLDHKLTEKDQIRGTILIARYGPNPLVASQGSGDSKQGGMSGIGEHDGLFIVGASHTFNPTLVMDNYVSFTHLTTFRSPQNVSTNFESIIPGLPVQPIEGAPQISFKNIQSISEAGSRDLEQDAQAYTTLTKVLSRHTIKVGASFLYSNHFNIASVSPARGSFAFNGRYTQGTSQLPNPGGLPTAFDYADFLLGYPSATGVATPAAIAFRNMTDELGFYGQDDFKVSSKLTLNFGLRYDLQFFPDNIYGLAASFNPSLGKVVVFANSYPAATLSAFAPLTVLAPSVGLPSSFAAYQGKDANNVAPRFGFAYQALHDTVIRGAVGVFYNLLPSSYVQIQAFEQFPFAAALSYSQPTGSQPVLTMNAPFGTGTGSVPANPGALDAHKPVTPYTEQYNLAIEHQLSRGLDIRIGYVGGLDIRIGYVGQHNLKQNNASGPGTTAPNINLAPIPQVGVTAQSTNLYQPFGQIQLYADPIFHSSMNSLQIGAHKQYSHGFQINAEYQWIRVLGTENVENPSGAFPQDSYGPIGGIAPQSLVVGYSYELPFGRTKSFLGASGALVDKIVSGWQISGISQFQNGQPFSVTYTSPGTPVGQVSGRANLVPGVPLYPTTKSKARWFNPAAFTAPPCFTASGTVACSSYTAGGPATYATYGNSGYNMLRGPRYQNWDMNLEKNIRFHEHYRVQLRGEAFNTFNHPNLSTPNSAISNTSNVGTITASSGTPGAQSRKLEFAAKFNF